MFDPKTMQLFKLQGSKRPNSTKKIWVIIVETEYLRLSLPKKILIFHFWYIILFLGVFDSNSKHLFSVHLLQIPNTTNDL